jgi:hypothetical protein
VTWSDSTKQDAVFPARKSGTRLDVPGNMFDRQFAVFGYLFDLFQRKHSRILTGAGILANHAADEWNGMVSDGV